MSDQSNNACETPILDLLRGVPADARMIYEESPTHHHSIPVGMLARRAADEIERLRTALEQIASGELSVTLCMRTAARTLVGASAERPS